MTATILLIPGRTGGRVFSQPKYTGSSRIQDTLPCSIDRITASCRGLNGNHKTSSSGSLLWRDIAHSAGIIRKINADSWDHWYPQRIELDMAGSAGQQISGLGGLG
jgi:hypothetical protein